MPPLYHRRVQPGYRRFGARKPLWKGVFLNGPANARILWPKNLPPAIRQEAAQNRPARYHKILHLIFPNPEFSKECLDNRHMAYSSVYLTETGHLLRQSGYREFPVIAARWEVKQSADAYGRGPGWKCLGDVKMLQKMQKAKLVALDKNTNPPVMVSANVQGEVNLLPGGITRYNGTTDAAVKPAYQVQADLSSLENAISSVRSTIRSQFFADVFLMLSAQNYSNMTAAEVAERHQEKMLILGPVLERLKMNCWTLLLIGHLPCLTAKVFAARTRKCAGAKNESRVCIANCACAKGRRACRLGTGN